jgi:phospholipase/carboxylesterase
MAAHIVIYLRLLVLLVLAWPVHAMAEQAVAPREAVVAHRQEGSLAGFHYLAFVTGGAKPTDRLPLVVGLHYSGAKLDDMVAYLSGIDFRARVVLPQGHYPRRADGHSWFPSDYSKRSPEEQKMLTFAVVDEISAFISSAAETFPSRGKPVVVGVSYGGDLSFLLAVRHPGQLAAAFPVAARFLPAWMPQENTCMPQCPLIYAMHGEQDTTVPTEPTRRAARRLSELGYRVEFHSYAGVPHDFSVEMTRDFVTKTQQVLALEDP